jgi:hypothetical protein
MLEHGEDRCKVSGDFKRLDLSFIKYDFVFVSRSRTAIRYAVLQYFLYISLHWLMTFRFTFHVLVRLLNEQHLTLSRKYIPTYLETQSCAGFEFAMDKSFRVLKGGFTIKCLTVKILSFTVSWIYSQSVSMENERLQYDNP